MLHQILSPLNLFTCIQTYHKCVEIKIIFNVNEKEHDVKV